MFLSRHSSGKRGQQEVSAGCLMSFERGHRLLQCRSEEQRGERTLWCVLLSCPQFCFCSIKLKTWKKNYIFEWHFKKMFKMLMLKHFEFNHIMKGISSNVEQFLLFEISNIMWPLVITLCSLCYSYEKWVLLQDIRFILSGHDPQIGSLQWHLFRGLTFRSR